MPLKTAPDSLGFIIAEISRLIRTGFERRIADAGLDITAGEARALLHVAAKDGARQTEIAERMGIEPMTVCTYMDRLEKVGLIDRMPDPIDRRAKNVRATDDAERMIAAIRSETAVVYALAQEGLDEDEREVFVRALGKMRTNLQNAFAKQPASKTRSVEGDSK